MIKENDSLCFFLAKVHRYPILMKKRLIRGNNINYSLGELSIT